MTLVIVDPAIAAEKFLKQAFTLKHSLADHPLFTLPRLVELAKAMPPQKAPGVSPAGDTVKVFAHDAMRAAIEPLRKSETARKMLRGLIYGRKANYYYEAKAGQ